MTDQTNKNSTGNIEAPQAWDMAVSIVEALLQALKQAEKEYQAASAKHYGKPFAADVSHARQIRDALDDAIRNMKPEVHQIARASRLPLPETFY